MPMSESFRIHAYLATIPDLRTCIRNIVTEAKTITFDTPQRDLIAHVSQSPKSGYQAKIQNQVQG